MPTPNSTASAKNLPKALKSASRLDLRKVQGVCLDIDDTLSTSGKLTPDAYAALWELKKAGYAVVPITGRPAGWCDHFARFWPVDAVVGENGAFTFFMESGIRKRINTPSGSNETVLKSKLDALQKKILTVFPKAKWASDQSYREYDLAIDVCEDVAAWTSVDVNQLLELCTAEGAHAKLSSVHINTWFGEYDKRKGFEHWLEGGAPGWKGKVIPKDKWLFIGDSPNDEPLFASFAYSVGVANLRKFLDRIQHPPTWITQGESGKGFAEMVRTLIIAKKSSSKTASR